MSAQAGSFLWHDYETFGTDPALDRPAQFAAIRTDMALQQVAEPCTWYCRPARDVLPHPFACLVTRITPQEATARGVPEAEFARRIHAEMMEPDTCGAGYNSLRFDDEFTRHLFYRNFFDPYEREWRNGNSRFDLINLTRMYYALRPEGIEWPEREPGQPSFRLEDLTSANAIPHSGAHDALADVRATIELARLLREANARLFAWGLQMRDQARVMSLLNPLEARPLLHTSSRYPAARGCTTLVLPLAVMPERPKSVIVFDLMSDPEPLLELDAPTIADLVFTPAADLPEELERIALKAVHTNKVPMVAPDTVLEGVDLDRIGLDPERCRRHARVLAQALASVRLKVMDVYAPTPFGTPVDPDVALYSGGFFSRRDRATLDRVLDTPPERLGESVWSFEDSRLPTLLFRYRARNWPDTLTTVEAERWEAYRRGRLLEPTTPGQLSVADFRQELAEARKTSLGDGGANAILDQLEAWLLELGVGSEN